jgi:hypothetical protein
MTFDDLLRQTSSHLRDVLVRSLGARLDHVHEARSGRRVFDGHLSDLVAGFGEHLASHAFELDVVGLVELTKLPS